MTTSTPRRADGSANIALLHEVWKQAHAGTEAFRLPCHDSVEANRMRTALYNSVRNVKKFPLDYPSMVDPVTECEIVKDESDPTVLLIRRKELSPRMLSLRATLEARGVAIPDSALRGTPATREMQASSDRLLEQLMGTDAEPTILAPAIEPLPGGHNPFFSRG